METRGKQSLARQVKEPLDTPLLHWTADQSLYESRPDEWRRVRHWAVGIRKDQQQRTEIAQAVLRYPKTGGLILAAKPEDLHMWQALFEQAGRKDDLSRLLA